MKPAIDIEYKIRTASRHSYLNKAKQLLKRESSQFEFFSELAEREQLGIEKLEQYYPLAQV